MEQKISYHIFYSYHTSPKDIEKMSKVFEGADVYFPEVCGWTPLGLKVFNSLSQGGITPEEAISIISPSLRAINLRNCQIIYNSKKPILLVDLPKGHKLLWLRDIADKLLIESLDLFERGYFFPSLEKLYDQIRIEALFESSREIWIKENLKIKTKDLVEANPYLKEKSEIKALLFLGVLHTGVYHALREEGECVYREFGYFPLIFRGSIEGVRTLMFSKKRRVDNLFLARAIFEDFLINYYIARKITDNTNKIITIFRKISSKLNLNTIKEISEEIGRDLTTMLDSLKERGINIPETEEEIDRMLR